MKVIVGSRDLWPTPSLASLVLSIMVSTDEGFGVRANSQGQVASSTEELVLRIAARLERPVLTFMPIGGGGNWPRDIRMVEAASEVFAFFADKTAEGGTSHVLDVALGMIRPVKAFHLDDEGAFLEVE